MKKLILDSGIVSAYMNRRDDIFERLQAEVRLGTRIGTCVPIVAEIAFGIELSASRDRNMAIFQRNMQSLTIWPFDERAVFSYGVIAAEQRRIGRPLQSEVLSGCEDMLVPFPSHAGYPWLSAFVLS